ncbi:HU family DNA-binding protein [Aquabacterium sp. OR-4]|uniref:HU family DNA-binding protein n=1 Tax=Aquabacterium sp. OR-4 TaxID=2978127 RepID=UPI0021B24611|nr:HU family DNA-binding protein [Aquabacterium sp. OR-4]MDT7836713.1 HU family DNA-binding protein [Aquabacterium sp. OR-4]
MTLQGGHRCNRRASQRPCSGDRRASENHQTRAQTRGGTFVNKTDLIEHIAKQADISKAAATRALDALIGGVKTTLKKNGNVSIVGFGTFTVTKRAARSGRNPRTGDVIKIKASKVPKFRPGKALKDGIK